MATEIQYNGSVIATPQAGQQVTLKCAGMKMAADVVIDMGEAPASGGSTAEAYVSPSKARLKLITSDGGAVTYHTLSPQALRESSESNLATKTFAGGIGADVQQAYVLRVARHDAGLCTDQNEGAIYIDGTLYRGVASARFSTGFYGVTSNLSMNQSYAITLPAFVVPRGKVKCTVADISAKILTPVEFDFETVQVAEYVITPSEAAYIYGYQRINIHVPKEAQDDLVVSFEIEYPKYDITVSNAADGVLYSPDDGLTFQSLSQSAELFGIEHLVLKNTGASRIDVGTADGGTDLGSLAAGGTVKVIVPNADGVIYIT